MRTVVANALVITCLFAPLQAQAQEKLPPIAQLVGDLQGTGIPAAVLGQRINAAFNQNLDHEWFAKSNNDFASTGPTDTVHLIQVIKDEALNAAPEVRPAYRRAWRTLCRRILMLRVPRPPIVHLEEHLDYPTARQEIVLMKLVTETLQATIDLWLNLDLGSAADLDQLRLAIAQARSERDLSETAMDRQKIGDIADAYRQFREIDDKMLALLALPPSTD